MKMKGKYNKNYNKRGKRDRSRLMMHLERHKNNVRGRCSGTDKRSNVDNASKRLGWRRRQHKRKLPKRNNEIDND